MERELSGEINPTKREQLRIRFENFSKNIRQQRRDFKSALDAGAKDDLIGGQDEVESNGNWTSDTGRQKMRENTDNLLGQQRYIDQMQSVIVETDGIANQATTDLSIQGERIKGQTSKVSGIGDAVQGARTIIGRMTRQQVIQSIALVVIILVLFAVIGIIIFFVVRPYLPSWGGSGSGSNATASIHYSK